MRCNKCPLYESWSNESDCGESCAIFGDAWDSQFQYEDKHGTVQGCYLEKAYINKVEENIANYYDEMVKAFIEEENVDRCVVCGTVIPEGRRVCPKCERGANNK